MVDQAPRHRPYDADVEQHEEKPSQPLASYQLGPSLRDYQQRSVPLFLSDRDGIPDPSEYIPSFSREHRAYYATRILVGALGGVVIAIVAALFSSSDTGREFIAGAKASSVAVFSAASAMVQPSSTPTQPAPTQTAAIPVTSTQTTPAQMTVADLPPPPAQPTAPEGAALGAGGVMVAAVTPTRDDIKTASAPESSAPPAAATPEPATVPAAVPQDIIHPLDAGEIAALLKRADSLMASGDVAAARLVLRRAAEAGDAHATMLLGGTYDPTVLEREGVRGVVPDLATARSWYEKAKRFGASEATAQLDLLAKKQN